TALRPFVVGLVPVVGRRGAVGGVLIDASGVVVRSDAETLRRLREARTRALQPIAADLQAASPLRKISLRGIGATLERLRRDGRAVTEDLQNLAGLQRVEYVFVYPEQQDVVLAGYAEG